ncbi:lactosylceramide 4-alpha-galactosyltransferase-like [Pieris napi]|uniref:lactosylceramide 4-alpha-galactosyltransferase-like n=1 Tax=Pieris napi TaxID=78633 RepID=UPI001FB8FE89|nr:lactosylceramide 4-alpha-galactosyltransferase-like [Pieris napi]
MLIKPRRVIRNIEIFIFVCVFGLSLYCLVHSTRELTTYELIHNNKSDDISCHYIDGDDYLPTVDGTFSPAPYPIFFHDTSCKGYLNSRQMCAIESAAISHPERNIYVFFSGPVSKSALLGKMSIMYRFSNVMLARVHIDEYSANTPIQFFIENGTLKNTSWAIENTSNVLRFLSLYKWGGVYLDTDVVVVKSFDLLGENWIAKEDVFTINSAAISLDNYTLGRNVASDFLDEIVKHYKSDNWAHNGPGVVTRVLTRYCGTDDLTKMTNSKCQGFTVLEPKYLYPIHYNDRMQYFQHGNPENYPDAYLHHIWNRLTHHLKVPKHSLYSKLAQRYCPSVYQLYNEEFGL